MPEDDMYETNSLENGFPNKDDLLDESVAYDKLLDDELTSDDILADTLLSNDELLESSLRAYQNDQISVPDLMEQLISSPEDPDIHALMGFSDLSRADIALIRKMWPSVPADRRRLVVTELVDFAQHDISYHLVRFLQLMLNDEDPIVRAAAVNGLWDDVAPELASEFLHLLQHDPDDSVRAAAAQMLGSYILAGELDELDSSYAMRIEQALLAIIHNLQEPVEIRARSLESVAFSSEVGVRQLIEDAYYSAEEEMRISSLVSMGRSADVRWRGLVRAELQNPSRTMRTQAAIATGELENRDALSDLILLLEDRSQSVRLGAIFALGRIGGKEATNALEFVSSHEDAPDEEIEAARFAMEEMAYYANPDSVSLLDESEAVEDNLHIQPWDDWATDLDFGFYEDDDSDDDDDFA